MRATVTFASRDEIAGRLRDDVWEAVRAILNGCPERADRERLLDDGRLALGNLLDPASTGTVDLIGSTARAVRRLAGEADAADPEAYVRRSPVTARIVEAFLAALRDRFLLLDVGALHRAPSGWPESWTWETRDHAEFHRVLDRLAPLVTAIEISNPSIRPNVR
ncbi:hypothetical protein [Spirillospora sp. NPDC048819]|uniref:hypothetical protein n=1 Tax=Spirillospora sp. NPDC048819 TaxID=3155268 RepID=UPI003411F04B